MVTPYMGVGSGVRLVVFVGRQVQTTVPLDGNLRDGGRGETEERQNKKIKNLFTFQSISSNFFSPQMIKSTERKR